MGHTSPLQGYDAGSAAFKRVYRAMSDDLGAAVSEMIIERPKHKLEKPTGST